VFDFAALDVALGLIFVYLVLSLVCTAVNETVSSILAWRADTLREGIANLLGGEGPRQALYAHPLVAGLIRKSPVAALAEGAAKPGRRAKMRAKLANRIPILRDERYPSYLPARVFAQAILTPGGKTAASVDNAIAALPAGQPREALELLWTQARGSEERFRESVETWYDEAMERVSGWYRRKVQFFLWIWAGAVVLLLHVDTIEIARDLWTDDAKRAAVVARAEELAAGPQPPSEESDQYLEEVDKLGIPIGWGGWPDGDWLDHVLVIPLNILGLGMTAVALTLGAPFWFDALKKVANIRGAGRAPEAKPVAKAGEAGEPKRQGRPPEGEPEP
jgi:hypothetical protein